MVKRDREDDTDVPNTKDLASILGIAAPERAAPEVVEEVIGSRDLFVGNIPPNCTPEVLVAFFNGAMMQVGLVPANGPPPVLSARFKTHFAFVECSSDAAASAALNLHGINCLGKHLKVNRTSQYNGPQTARRTWQEVIGAPPEPEVLSWEEEAGSGANADNSGAVQHTKCMREVFVGNYDAKTMSQGELSAFLATTLYNLCLVDVMNPFAGCANDLVMALRHRGADRFCFLELRTPQQVANVLNLANIKFQDSNLKLSRPSRIEKLDVPRLKWDELLQRWAHGDLKLLGAGRPTRVVEILGAVGRTGDLLRPRNRSSLKERIEDIRQEAQRFGEVEELVCPTLEATDEEAESILDTFAERCQEMEAMLKEGRGICMEAPLLSDIAFSLGSVVVKYSMMEDAKAAVQGMKGRSFDGHIVDVRFIPIERRLPTHTISPRVSIDQGVCTSTPGATSVGASREEGLGGPRGSVLSAKGIQPGRACIAPFRQSLKDAEVKTFRSLGYDV